AFHVPGVQTCALPIWLVYEKFRTQLRSGPVPSQRQLIPVVIDLPEEDCGRLEEAAPVLEKLGLYLERFGPGAVAINETPALLGQDRHRVVEGAKTVRG